MFGPLPMALISGKVKAKVSFESWQLPNVTWIDDGLMPSEEDDD
jgi:inner membrane protease subunit 1